jgi:protocatechuate 3,4-dioxygenase beta subunit
MNNRRAFQIPCLRPSLVLAPLIFIAGCAWTTPYGRPISRPSSPPASVKIEPAEATNLINTQHRVKAVVRDAEGKPVHSALVEWILARTPGAVGDIVEVGQDPWERALKLDNTYAIGGTDTNGESPITITSVQEGITHITAVVPDIKDKTKHKAFAVKNWFDARWEFPQPATNRTGTKHVMATRVVRASNGEPLSGYEVRWKVASGPPAMFEESGRPESATKTDEQGIARVTLIQPGPVAGMNTIEIAVVKPREPARACCPTPSGVIAKGSTTKTWTAP